jgi:hypothetical protein
MAKLFTEKLTGYKEDVMSKSVCLICGEQIGEYVYRGNSICTECMKLIRSNY